MTTTVTIEAHCAPNKEVRVDVFENPDEIDGTVVRFTLQDGQKAQNRSIRVREVLKP